MQRKISTLGLLLLIVNGTIGSAWLFAPFYAAQIAGPYAILAWLIGGFMTITIAFTFAETSSHIPLAGGTTEVAEYTHGGFTAFFISWVAWLSNITMPPIEVEAVLQYAANYLPGLTHMVNGQSVLTFFGFTSAFILMILLTVLNVLSLKNIVRSNFFILVFKLLTITLTIYMIIHSKFITDNFTTNTLPLTNAATWKDILAAVSMGGIAFAFTGFKHGVELAGESQNPKFTIPFAIIGSVILCVILYLGLQIAFIGAVDANALSHGWSKLAFAGDIGPFVGIATALGLAWLAKLLMVDAVVSPLGTGSVYVSSNARVTYAMAQKGYFPQFLGNLDKNELPIKAICFNSLIGMLLFMPLPNWQEMVSFLVSIMVISYAMGPIALLAMRRNPMQDKTGLRLPYPKVFGFIAFYFCNLISYWTGWNTMSKFSIALLLGLVVFFIAYSRMDQAKRDNMCFGSIGWLMSYFTGLTVISYLGAFKGGLNVIGFGYDFVIIGIFSLIIYYFAILASKQKK
jgi:amino acid transporter